jgi:hypothetical protein
LVYGNVDPWADTFPGELVPEILDVVIAAWARFPQPDGLEEEETITRRFRNTLRQERDFRKLPVRLDRECWLDEEASAEVLGRLDLRLTAAGQVREDVYFAFECKRLNVLFPSGKRSLASDYVEEGMMRFVESQYSPEQETGGMLGYVMDGQTDAAIEAVERALRARCAALKMDAPGGLAVSTLRPEQEVVKETVHQLGSRRFLLHHVLLAVQRMVGTCA